MPRSIRDKEKDYVGKRTREGSFLTYEKLIQVGKIPSLDHWRIRCDCGVARIKDFKDTRRKTSPISCGCKNKPTAPKRFNFNRKDGRI